MVFVRGAAVTRSLALCWERGAARCYGRAAARRLPEPLQEHGAGGTRSCPALLVGFSPNKG